MKKFDDNKNIKTYKDSSIIKRLLKYMKPVLPYFIIALFFTAIVVVVDLLPAILEGYIIGLLNLDFANPSVKDKQLFEIASKFKEMNNLSDSDAKLYGALIIDGFYLVVIVIHCDAITKIRSKDSNEIKT